MSKQITTGQNIPMGNESVMQCTLPEMQTFLMSILDSDINNRVEIHFHISQTNTHGINVYGNNNSIKTGNIK